MIGQMLCNDIRRNKLKLLVRLEDQAVEGLDHNNHAPLSYSSTGSQSPVTVIDLIEITKIIHVC